MNTPFGSSSSASKAARGGLRLWFAARPARERYLMVLCLGLIGISGLFWIAFKPAWTTLRAASARHAALDAQWQSMQTLANQARALQALPNKSVAEVRQQLQTTVRSCFGAQALWQVQGSSVQVALQQVGAAPLAQCLVQLPVASAQLQRQGDGSWSGEITLRWPQE